MLIIVLALFFGTFSGTVVGGLMSWWLLAQAYTETTPLERLPVDPDMDERIDKTAERWAAAHHQPFAEPLVANKLRLVHALNQRRARRHGRRWSR
jgi:hypothetical protein